MNSYHDEYKLITKKIVVLALLQVFIYFWLSVSFIFHVLYSKDVMYLSYTKALSTYVSFWEIFLILIIYISSLFTTAFLADAILKKIYEIHDLEFRDNLNYGEQAIWGTKLMCYSLIPVGIILVFNPVAMLNVFIVMLFAVANLYLIIKNLQTSSKIKHNWRTKSPNDQVRNVVVEQLTDEFNAEQEMINEIKKDEEELKRKKKFEFEAPVAKEKLEKEIGGKFDSLDDKQSIETKE